MLKSFKFQPEPPTFIGGISEGSLNETIAKTLGSRWSRTPMTGVYLIGNDQMSFTLCKGEIARYTESPSELKEFFREHGFLPEAVEYYEIDSTYKYTGLQVYNIYKEKLSE